MLRIVPTQSAAQAKSYYSTSDYYTADQELPGVWKGKGAERLGLAGTVEKAQFEALCDNLHPSTGEPITAATRSNRTVGYDFNFHAPKSLSLLHGVTNDTRLLAAFQSSVDETMALVEADMQTRVRKSGQDTNRTTGEMLWARFDHFTARPIDGVPDPHLHSHAFVQNMTFDGVEGQWKAGQFRNLKRDAPFYQAVFHSKLTAKLRDMGLPLEKTKDGWEIQGFNKKTLTKFSRRTQQIEAIAEAKAITDPNQKAELGAKTRKGKAKNLSMKELRELWSERLDADEHATIERLRGEDVTLLEAVPDRESQPSASRGLPAKMALAFACQHVFERNSVVSERRLLGEMLNAGLGRFTVNEAEAALRDSDVIVRTYDGQRLATTHEVLAEERQVIDFARDGRGKAKPLGLANDTIRRDWLNDGQRAAVQHLVTSKDRVMMIRGSAGVGKTTLMQEAVEAIQRGGHRVLTLAPSADASRGVLRKEGFANADTVARFLVDREMQEQARGQVVWIDEAGLLGTKTMKQVFAVAEQNDCRVILSGDARQHGSVARGSVLTILQQFAGLPVAEVKEIQRQKGEYKEAVKLLADGHAGEGFDKLDGLGWVKEVADEERDQRLAADYVTSVNAGQSVLVVSPTHAEGAAITTSIREKLREESRLTGEEQQFSRLVRVDLTEAERGRADRYCDGDVIQFHQNAKGFTKGQRLVVNEGTKLPLDQAERFHVYRPQVIPLAVGERVRITLGGSTKDGHQLENGSLYSVAGFSKRGDVLLNNGWTVDRNYGHLTHGYVTTSHAAQGKTVDRVLIGQSSESWGASSREQFYVSASRGRHQVVVYTNDKESLRDAIQQTDPRLSASELVARTRLDRARRQKPREREYELRREREAMRQKQQRERDSREMDR
jgi:conjugative relaxase-like TrwC/TraI family protein